MKNFLFTYRYIKLCASKKTDLILSENCCQSQAQFLLHHKPSSIDMISDILFAIIGREKYMMKDKIFLLYAT